MMVYEWPGRRAVNEYCNQAQQGPYHCLSTLLQLALYTEHQSCGPGLRLTGPGLRLTGNRCTIDRTRSTIDPFRIIGSGSNKHIRIRNYIATYVYV